MTSRARLLGALARQPLPDGRPPLWLMRQAGRYLPEYRALKAQHSFVEMVRTPELAVEVTLQPLRRYAFDAAILFSDILVIPEALGQPYRFREGGGIAMDWAIERPSDLDRLSVAGLRERLAYVPEALRRLRTTLPDHTLLGFAGSPWTLALYMLEGGGSDDFARARAFLSEHPAAFHRLMELLTEAVATHLRTQLEAGADAVQLFDSWGGLCPGYAYHELSLRWLGEVIRQLPPGAPVILFAKGMSHHAPALAATGATALSLDWTTCLDVVATQVPGVALQGNLDPVVLNTTPAATVAAVRRVLGSMAGRPGHIFNLGHGILPQARLECVQALVDTVTHSNPA